MNKLKIDYQCYLNLSLMYFFQRFLSIYAEKNSLKRLNVILSLIDLHLLHSCVFFNKLNTFLKIVTFNLLLLVKHNFQTVIHDYAIFN